MGGVADEEFLASLTSVASRTVAAYRTDVAAFSPWAGARVSSDRTSIDRFSAATWLTSRRGVRPAVDRPEGVGAPPLLRLGGPAGNGRGRSPRWAFRSRAATVVCRAAQRTSSRRSSMIPCGAGDDPVLRARDAVLELLYGSGLRVGELCALSVGDVDLAPAFPCWERVPSGDWSL